LRRYKYAFVVMCLALCAAVVTGCGSSSDKSDSSGSAETSGSAATPSTSTAAAGSSASSETKAVEFTAPSPGGVVSSLPADVQAAYKGFDGSVEKSPWVNFKPKHGPPWTIGYASSYAGNTWRSGSLDALQKVLVPKYQKAGLIKKLIVTQSNLKDSVQIQQVRQLIDQGADILLFCCPSTALKPVVDAAAKQGVPSVTFSGHNDSTGSINLYSNYLRSGFDQATFIAQQMGGKGNLLYVNGIPGQASNTSVDDGVKMALKNYPDIKVVGTVSGQWTDQIAKTEVLKFLATHPTKIDGVITQSAQEVGVLQAFLQSGRPLPPMTQGGEKGTACYWVKNPDWKTKVFNIWPPADEAEGAISVMVRILQGQGPKIASITREPTSSTLDEVKKELGTDCDVNDSSWFNPVGWFSDEYLDKFFENPKARIPA
jgi:ribose transport system substrate-binding protein